MAEAKLSTTLLEVARANDLQVTKLYPKEAILLGYHPALKRKAIVTYTASHGIKVWYWHDNPEEITNEDFLKQTREYLLDIAKERGVEVEDAAKMHPAKLADIIFCKLVPEVKA
jgi:diketogulonate reductase-like aldo/keto reductase